MTYRQLTEGEYSDFASRILYEDNHLLIVNKLPGEITQGDKTGDECLAESYKAFIAQRDSKPGQVFMGIPHRLDRPVSGIVVLAKTSKALSRLNVMFRVGSVDKRYLAIVKNCPKQSEGRLENWLVRNEKQNRSYAYDKEVPGSKQAILNYRLVASSVNYHLLEIELLTGRHHQIRCQLAKMGCPIKGDLKYGAERSNPDGSISLHAYHVTFEHPVSHEMIDVKAPLPEDSLWQSFRDSLQ